jgi:Asp-tRNA(Asn)/Glu-tRNA(Gln) amidotransferase A subunit family amidase
MCDLVFSSTNKLASAVRTRQVSAAEVLEAHLAQIDKHNPALNAVVTIQPEAARKRAREADEALTRGQVWGPLHGVPFTLKDAHSTAGMRTTVGFLPRPSGRQHSYSSPQGRRRRARRQACRTSWIETACPSGCSWWGSGGMSRDCWGSPRRSPP